MALDMIVDSADLNAGLTMIGDAIREKTGGAEGMEFPKELAAGVSQVYDAGVAAENARCAEKHFATTVLGNGETSISFRLPFAPDYLAIFCSDSDIWTKADPTVYGATFDLAAFGLIAGIMFVSNSSGFANNAMSTESYKTRYSRAEDGTVTIGNLGATVGKFKTGRPYMVCAVKYLEQSDKERITEYVRSLTGSGSVTLNKAKVNAAFTDAEWAVLIAEKPGYTFNFV